MINLLKFQFRNLLKNKMFYIFLCLTMLENFVRLRAFEGKIGLADFVAINIFEIIILCIFATFDSDNCTIKNIIAKGYDKVRLLFSKYIVAIFILIVFVLLKVLMYFMFAKHTSGVWTNLGQNIICLIPEVIFYVTLSIIIGKLKISLSTCVLVQIFIPSLLIFIDKLDKLNVKLLNYWLGCLYSLDNVSKIIVSLIYTALFVAIGIFAVRRKEIK